MNDEPMNMLQPLPMRSGDEQWAIAGLRSFKYATLSTEGLVFVDGHGGRCAMRVEEWVAYERLCDEARQIAEATPLVSMREATADEDPLESGVRRAEGGVVASDLGRIYDSLRTELRQIRALIGTAKGTLSVEDYGDALAGAFDRLGVCVGCVDALRERNDECRMTNAEVLSEDEIEISGLKAESAKLRGELRRQIEGRRDDVRELNERLSKQARDYLETVEDLRAENRRLRGLLDQKAGIIISDLSAKLQAETEKLLEEMKGGPDAA